MRQENVHTQNPEKLTQGTLKESSGQQQGAAGENLKQESQGVAEKARETGRETARRATEQGEAYLSEQKGTAAETLHHCSEALRAAADQLREKQDANLASLAGGLAERLERTSDYLQNHQLQEIRQDVESFARRQPQIFYGGMFVAGLALARFFKASQSQSRSQFQTQGDYQQSETLPETAGIPT